MKLLKQDGFTLIEILIAITLLSFVMLSVVSITDGSITTKERVTREDEKYLQLETAMNRLDWDISQAYSPLYFSHEMKPENLTEEQGEAYNRFVAHYQNNERFAFPSYDALPVPTYKSQDKSTITFFTTSNRRKLKNIKQSHFAWVQYTIENDDRNNVDDNEVDAKGVLVRKFSPHNVFSNEAIDWSKTKSQILLRNVESIVYEFWNPETRKWTDNLDTIKNGNHLFRGVKLTLEWINPDGLKTNIIRVFRPTFPNFTPEDMYKLEKQSEADFNETGTTEANEPEGTEGADATGDNDGADDID